MNPIMDVSYQSFQNFRRNNPLFYWMETSSAFVLLKFADSAIARTTIAKSGTIDDDLWREMNLLTAQGAVFIDGSVDFGPGEDIRAIRSMLEKRFSEVNNNGGDNQAERATL